MHVEVRIISASKKDLQRLVADGKFREDLYYRLNGVCIRLPDLKERKEDIPLLIEHFASEIAARGESPVRRFSPGAMRAIMAYEWPGNVREVRNFVEKTLVIASNETITKDDVHFDDLGPVAGLMPSSSLPDFRQARENFERQYVEAALRGARGNVSKAAKLTGLSRESLYRLLRKHNIDR